MLIPSYGIDCSIAGFYLAPPNMSRQFRAIVLYANVEYAILKYSLTITIVTLSIINTLKTF